MCEFVVLSPLKINSAHQRAMYPLKVTLLVSPERDHFGKHLISANMDNEERKKLIGLGSWRPVVCS